LVLRIGIILAFTIIMYWLMTYDKVRFEIKSKCKLIILNGSKRVTSFKFILHQIINFFVRSNFNNLQFIRFRQCVFKWFIFLGDLTEMITQNVFKIKWVFIYSQLVCFPSWFLSFYNFFFLYTYIFGYTFTNKSLKYNFQLHTFR